LFMGEKGRRRKAIILTRRKNPDVSDKKRAAVADRPSFEKGRDASVGGGGGSKKGAPGSTLPFSAARVGFQPNSPNLKGEKKLTRSTA